MKNIESPGKYNQYEEINEGETFSKKRQRKVKLIC